MKEQAEVTDGARQEMQRITRLATDKLNEMKKRTDKMIERYRHIASETEQMMVTNENLHTNLTRQSDAIHVAHETLHASMTSMKEADEILAGGLDYHSEYEANRNAPPSASYVLAAGAVVMLFA
jgi:thiamine monophosphate synthase